MQSAKAISLGTHRSTPACETWGRIEPLLPLMGITRVADLTGLDAIGIPVFQAIRPNSRTISVSQGKGITPMLARVSAAMEAIETWHAEENELPTHSATVAEMTPKLPYSPYQLPKHPRSLLSSQTLLPWVTAQVLNDESALSSEQRTYVPQALVGLDLTNSQVLGVPIFKNSSNGLASGNTFEEALLHALYELLERHAVAHTQSTHPDLAIDLRTVAGCAGDLLAKFRDAGVSVEVRDLTDTVGLPCFEAVVWSMELPVTLGGWGCHLDSDVALSRALTEAAQTRLTLIAGARDDLTPFGDVLARRAVARNPLTRATRAKPYTRATATHSLKDDLKTVRRHALRLAAGPVMWVDLSNQNIKVPVVKAFVPGLDSLAEV